MRCPILAIPLSLFVLWAAPAIAQTKLQAVKSWTCPPGQTTRLTIDGQGLDDSLRFLASSLTVELEIESLSASQAVLQLTVPKDAPRGPMALWAASAAGPLPPQVLLVDELPAVADNGKNHTWAAAQSLATPCAVEGRCDGSASDFYRFTVTAGQRLAFEIHTQGLQSAMDPVVRLLGADGTPLRVVDDSLVGPDGRFSHTFAAAGEFGLQIQDSRHAAAGSPYHLRLGDFPLLSHCMPLAVSPGERTLIKFYGPDSQRVADQMVEIPADSTSRQWSVAVRFPEGVASSWLPLRIQTHASYVEPQTNPPATPPAATAASPATATTSQGESTAGAASAESQRAEERLLVSANQPLGISGHLGQPQEIDRYCLQGVAGQRVRVTARARSLGLPTLLNMSLQNTSGNVVAHTTVGEEDEWSFEFTFPDDAEYQLEVSDLLHRGGEEFGYWIEVAPAASFALSFAAAATSRQQFAIAEQQGACAVDLEIDRRGGYEGAIDVSLVEAIPSVKIMNARISAGAKQARIFLLADEPWSAAALSAVHLRGTAADEPALQSVADSRALHRVQQPSILLPAPWNDGVLLLAGTPPESCPFTLEPSVALQFARPLKEHSVHLNLVRLQKEFKGGVEFLNKGLPSGWNLAAKADKDTYTVTCTVAPTAINRVAENRIAENRIAENEIAENDVAETAPAERLPQLLPLQVFAEFQGRGRVETISLPIEWIDPVDVTLELPEALIAGGPAMVQATVVREGSDPQPVTLAFTDLPASWSVPEEVTVAADQSHAEFSLPIPADAPSSIALRLSAGSQYQGQTFSVSSNVVRGQIQPSPQRIEAFPSSIVLSDPRARQQVLVSGYGHDDKPRDWTQAARLTSLDPNIVEVRGSVLFPLSDGSTELLVEVGSARQSIAVEVSGMNAPRPVAFETEVLVALSKQGCNSGACHGSPSGKGGFRLSLRAFDRQLDELTLIREDFGRRVNPLEAAKSLLLHKPLMKVAHGGGKQLHEEDVAYQILRNWIAEGARADPPDAPRCVRLQVTPGEKRVLPVSSGGQQLAVTAHFADGTQRDVTHLVAYDTSNTDVATVDRSGFVSPQGRGEAAILVRYLEFIESLPLMFVEEHEDFRWQAPPANNYVDELVNAKLRQLQFLPAETCSDSEFLRRVYLDVIGILPTVTETREFLADTSSDKRARCIDRLLQRDEYAKFWALKWGDLLKMTGKLVGQEGVYKYHRWLEEALRSNMPYDRFAQQLLTASGSTLANPPANFYRTSSDMNECVETVSQVFLGARLQCAKCHNHPFERWTQDNYYGLGAFFQRVERRKTVRPGELFIYAGATGEVTQPRTGQIMQPWLPQIGEIPAEPDTDRRVAFAEWLVARDNPYFARIEANRLWSQLFARGIVDPIDDFRDSNPPANAPLLDALAADFVDSGFDRKHLLRVILNSRTYQASYATNDWNRDDILYFSHQEPRLLGAEQLLDAINATLDLTQTFGSLPVGTRATQLPAPDVAQVDFLKVFGQPERTTVCACERAAESNLGMAIELFNGPALHAKLRDPTNRFHRAIAMGSSLESVISELYLAAVCREPSPAELTAALEHCAASRAAAALAPTAADESEANTALAAGLEDVCWALFNTDEFLFQH